MRTRPPKLLPSAERYAARPRADERLLDPNVIERAAMYLATAELINSTPARRPATVARRSLLP